MEKPGAKREPERKRSLGIDHRGKIPKRHHRHPGGGKGLTMPQKRDREHPILDVPLTARGTHGEGRGWDDDDGTSIAKIINKFKGNEERV